VNDKWCQITKYSQIECERKELMKLLNGNMRADFNTLKRTGKPDYDFNKFQELSPINFVISLKENSSWLLLHKLAKVDFKLAPSQ